MLFRHRLKPATYISDGRRTSEFGNGWLAKRKACVCGPPWTATSRVGVSADPHDVRAPEEAEEHGVLAGRQVRNARSHDSAHLGRPPTHGFSSPLQPTVPRRHATETIFSCVWVFVTEIAKAESRPSG
ncbi:hypothetical protein PR048_003539 [Dryococelus australis]|uniref:Uncharacterized protein n=1 Tax=Dryococelus australis TaxID=614101 RepID=A0ABQ9IPM6_9NEOP|nr:hypothetical protein PR048_003539 [Dryococelus australis]